MLLRTGQEPGAQLESRITNRVGHAGEDLLNAQLCSSEKGHVMRVVVGKKIAFRVLDFLGHGLIRPALGERKGTSMSFAHSRLDLQRTSSFWVFTGSLAFLQQIYYVACYRTMPSG